MKEAISQTFDRMNENKSEKEKEMNNKKEFLRIVVTGTAEHPYYTIDYIENGEEHNGYGSYNLGYVIKWKEVMEKKDKEENVKHISPETLKKINISAGEGTKKFQEEKAQRADMEKDSMVGKKFVIEIEEENEDCLFVKTKDESFFETVCKIKGTDAYIKKTDLDKLEKREEKKKEGKIKVGDEIKSSEQTEKAVVLWIEADGYLGCLKNNLFFTVNDKQKKYWKKTGKHYDEVEKIFQKLKESEGDIPFL